MGWNSNQNPTGVHNPAVRDIPIDPATLTTSAKDARSVLQRRPKGIVDNSGKPPISGASVKAEGMGAPGKTYS